MKSIVFFAVFVLVGQFKVNQSQLISQSNQSQSQSNVNQNQLVNQFNVSQDKIHLNVSQSQLTDQLNLNQSQPNVNQSELTDQSNVDENQLASRMNVNDSESESEIQNQNETCFCRQKTFIGLIMTHPLAAYCISEFTARVHVKGEQVIQKPDNHRLKVYDVFVEHIYKGSLNARTALNDSKLYTVEKNACALNLIVNKTYVVTGWALPFEKSFKVFSYDCFYYSEIGQINQKVRQGIEGGFKCP